MSAPPKNASSKFGPWQFVVVGFSSFMLASLVAETFFAISPDVRAILRKADYIVCAVFLIDFGFRFRQAENKWAYMRTWGWIDFISSIPMLDSLRWGRVFRLMRILRVLRAIRSSRIIFEFVFANRARGSAATAAVFSIFLLVGTSIAIFQFESAAEQANIKSGLDAMWWCLTTITTVGYGDRFPITPEGRIVGTILMTTGVGMFGVLSGIITTWFLGRQENREDVTLRELKTELEQIKQMLAARVQAENAGTPPEPDEARVYEASTEGYSKGN